MLKSIVEAAAAAPPTQARSLRSCGRAAVAAVAATAARYALRNQGAVVGEQPAFGASRLQRARRAARRATSQQEHLQEGRSSAVAGAGTQQAPPQRIRRRKRQDAEEEKEEEEVVVDAATPLRSSQCTPSGRISELKEAVVGAGRRSGAALAGAVSRAWAGARQTRAAAPAAMETKTNPPPAKRPREDVAVRSRGLAEVVGLFSGSPYPPTRAAVRLLAG